MTPELSDVVLSDEELRDLRTAIAQADRGQARALSQEQLEHWAATGEWPTELQESSS